MRMLSDQLVTLTELTTKISLHICDQHLLLEADHPIEVTHQLSLVAMISFQESQELKKPLNHREQLSIKSLET